MLLLCLPVNLLLLLLCIVQRLLMLRIQWNAIFAVHRRLAGCHGLLRGNGATTVYLLLLLLLYMVVLLLLLIVGMVVRRTGRVRGDGRLVAEQRGLGLVPLRLGGVVGRFA